MKKIKGYVAFTGGKKNLQTVKAAVLPMKSLPKVRGKASAGMLKEDLGKC